MTKAIITGAILICCFFATLSNAEQVRKVTNITIEKVQTTGINSGQISISNEGWALFRVKSKSELNKAVTYFSKLDQDSKAEVYLNGEDIVGVVSAKYGNFGTPPIAASAGAKTYIGVLNGCSMHQGSMNCGINVSGKDYYLDDSSTDSKLLEKLYPKSAIGKKVKVSGLLDGETINAKSIQFIK